jgi:hypothetical protein
MIKAELQGRRLILTVETADDETPIEPYRVEPLSGKVGRQLSMDYSLMLVGQTPDGFNIGDAMITATGQENYDRLSDELRQEEAEQIIQAAFYWQTAIGMDGVRAILEGGVGGMGKASALFAQRMAPLLPPTSPRSASENPTPSPDDTPNTSTPEGGVKLVKKPLDRLPKQPAKAKKPKLPAT